MKHFSDLLLHSRVSVSFMHATCVGIVLVIYGLAERCFYDGYYMFMGSRVAEVIYSDYCSKNTEKYLKYGIYDLLSNSDY